MDERANQNTSAFDRFIKRFSENHLEKRIKYVCLILSFLMISTLVAIVYSSFQNFEIIMLGTGKMISNNEFQTIIEDRYKKNLEHQSLLTMYLKSEPSGQLFHAQVQVLEIFKKNSKWYSKFKVTQIPKDHSIPNQFSYQIYLEKKPYYKILLEKAEN